MYMYTYITRHPILFLTSFGVLCVQVSLDRDNMEVRVRAGTTLRDLNEYLQGEGLAMKNLGSVSEQTVAGAISTGV